MNNYYIHLYSEIPAVFMIDGKQVGFVEYPNQSIDILSDQPSFLLYVYPTIPKHKSNTAISYSAEIAMNAGKLFCDNSNIEITYYGKSHFKINATPLYVHSQAKNIPPFYQKIDDCTFSIIKGTLFAQSKEHNFYYPLPCDLDKINIKKINDFFVLSATEETGQNYILILNANLQLQFDALADKIEFDGKTVVTLQNVYDIARHGLVKTFKFNKTGFAKTQQYSVYTQSEPVSPANYRALPWAFMEAVNIQNYTLARSYLHPNLSQVLKDEHISAYFGDFLEVLPSLDNDYSVLALVYSGNPRFVKNYKFEIIENRIYNIDCQD